MNLGAVLLAVVACGVSFLAGFFVYALRFPFGEGALAQQVKEERERRIELQATIAKIRKALE